MTKNTRPTNSVKAHLTDAEVMTLLENGQTYAVEVIGDLPVNYIEAVIEGLIPDFRASVLGENNRLARFLAEYGGEVRVAPLPVLKDRWQLQVFQAEGVLHLAGRGQDLDLAKRLPAEAGFRRDLANFGLTAPFDGYSFSSSWEAHPRKLRSEYVALMGQPKRYYRRINFEARLIPRLQVLQDTFTILCGTLTSIYLVLGQPRLLSFIATASGFLSIGCYFYAQYVLRRVNRVVSAADKQPYAD